MAHRIKFTFLYLITFYSTHLLSQNDYTSDNYLIKSVYETISGKAGERDWDTFRSLFHKDAYLASIVTDGSGNSWMYKISPEEYISKNQSIFLKYDFFEKEVFRRSLEYGNMKTIYSAYEYELYLENNIHIQRGINSIQLLFENNRWWILSLVWVEEKPDNPIPEYFLKN